RLLYALGIPNFGRANARVISDYCRNSWSRIETLTEDELVTIDGIGSIMADSYVKFFSDPEKKRIVSDLLKVLTIDETYTESGEKFKGMTFVITGSLKHFENREQLKQRILAEGGKVAGSVSAKTTYLINNDVNSTSGKNKTAHELNIPIIDEDTIISWLS
ncbi:MAG: NAD-dependent DNA ligase LigA, partial [Clostridia bacterium]|nr:NAD-dependent DNA ligase LigA [Clostridia bacterium]